MTTPAPEKPDVRWLPPDADALQAFEELRGQIAKTLIEAANLCAQLRAFTVPAGDDDGPIEIVWPERLVRTIGIARNAAARVLEDTDPAEAIKRAATAIFLTGALVQIFALVQTRKPADA